MRQREKKDTRKKKEGLASGNTRIPTRQPTNSPNTSTVEECKLDWAGLESTDRITALSRGHRLRRKSVRMIKQHALV